MDDATRQGRCMRCGAELAADAPGGLCPVCLLTAAMATEPFQPGDDATVLSAEVAWGASPGSGPRLLPGASFGPYRIEKLLGRGGMGEVYAAEHLEHGRRLALKVLRARLAGRDDRARFLREGQLAASINHPHSVYIFGSEEIAGLPIITMELLPGGTLKDKVLAEGPLAPTAAVDVVLDMIGGLDAAQAAGILHRDIKPANCFVDYDGTVKIGDFGLSISTAARGMDEPAGVFQGTPQFAAPEQLRGEPLDVRADIYAVGGTLFYLLTGQAPFDDADLTTLVTRVKGEPARSPLEINARVPQGLATIVSQCLAKDKTARPATYAALADALRPFNSAAPGDALLRTRFAAAVIDYVLVALVVSVFRAVAIAVSTGVGATGAGGPAFLCISLYFTLTEGLTGASAGKRILGLQVRAMDGGTPGLPAAFVRSIVFVLAARGVLWIPTSFWAGLFLPAQAGGFEEMTHRAAAIRTLMTAVSLVLPFVPLLLFLPARSRDGYAGIHELVSGTRVTAAASTEPLTRPRLTTVQGSSRFENADIQRAASRGPFVLVRLLVPEASLWLGFDRALMRSAWIRDAPAGSSLSDVARRDLSRPGRLRWLGGRSTSTGTWQAFEAPSGESLLSRIGVPQPWWVVRHWLAELAEELTHGRRDIPALGLDRVWITADGRAKLLEFPAPGAGRCDAVEDELALLTAVAYSALAGQAVTDFAALPIPRPPLPLSGTAVLLALRGPRPESLDTILDRCNVAVAAPARLSRWGRAFQPALLAAVCALWIVGVIVGVLTMLAPLHVRRGLASGTFTSEEGLFLNSLATVERMRRTGAGASDPDRRAVEVFIAARFPPLARRSELDGALRPFRPLAEEIARRYPSPSDAEVVAAARQMGPAQLDRLSRGSLAVELPGLVFPGVLHALAKLGYLSLVLAFICRGGLILRLFQTAVVDTTGTEVSRWKALLRAGIAWSPVLAFQFLPQPALLVFMTFPLVAWTVVGTIVALMAVGTCWSIVVPERGWQDWIGRTWLVPR